MEQLVQWLPQFVMNLFTHVEQAIFFLAVLMLMGGAVVFCFWVRIMKLVLRRLERSSEQA